MLQVRMGGGQRPFGGAFRGIGGVRGVFTTLVAPENWMYLAAVVVLLLVVAVLAVLILREIYLRTKKKD